MKHHLNPLKTALRTAGYDVRNFYGSGGGVPSKTKGWVRVWLADERCDPVLRVAPELPMLGDRQAFLDGIQAVLLAQGWKARLRAVAFSEEWER